PGKLSLRGLEVWVANPDDADRARQLIAENAEELQAKRGDRTGDVEARCEECETATIFPAADAGTVQKCPNCGAYLDVPGADEEWDVGEPEGEREEGEPRAG